MNMEEDEIIVIVREGADIETPRTPRFRLCVIANNHVSNGWGCEGAAPDWASAPIYSLTLTFSCAMYGEIAYALGDPPIEEQDTVNEFNLGAYRTINGVAVLVIERTLDEMEEGQEIAIDVSARFTADWRCPISDYAIDKVVEGGAGAQ